MIRVTVLYPNKPGARFDHAYYAGDHANLVKQRYGPFGFIRSEVDKGLSGMTPDAPAPYVALGHLVFNSVEDFQKAIAAHGEEVIADIATFTDIEPQIQISEIVA